MMNGRQAMFAEQQSKSMPRLLSCGESFSICANQGGVCANCILKTLWLMMHGRHNLLAHHNAVSVVSRHA